MQYAKLSTREYFSFMDVYNVCMRTYACVCVYVCVCHACAVCVHVCVRALVCVCVSFLFNLPAQGYVVYRLSCAWQYFSTATNKLE